MDSLSVRQIRSTFGAAVCVTFVTTIGLCQEPVKLSVCQLKENPAAFNHKVVQVTAFVSHGFEDFMLFDPNCSSWPGVWLEYGGTLSSGTVYCCGGTAERSRPKQLVVEKMPIPLLRDERFEQFDRLIQRRPDSVVHSTVLGRFFAGRQIQNTKKVSWDGYGHMGCCSLLAVQQIVSVDPHDRDDLDYGASSNEPDINKVGCGFQILTSLEPYNDVISAQQKAEMDERAWAFDDPHRVAVDALARLLKIDEASISKVEQRGKAQGRFIYEWRPWQKSVSYMVVVSHPYWLTFYSKDPKRTAWVVIGAYESSCGKSNSVQRIR